MRVGSFATPAGADRRERPGRGRSIRTAATATAAAAVAWMVWAGGAAPAHGLAPASTTTTTAPPAAKAEVLVDVATGRVLVGQNDHVPLPPASLTKMLTAMIAADWLPPGTVVPVSAQAAAAYPDRVGMKVGQRWPLAIALRTLLVFSANDSAYALAQRVGGSLAGFAVIMRQAGAQLGLSGPMVLRDPAGLDGTEGFEGGNLLSAWDVAITARDLMANPPWPRSSASSSTASPVRTGSGTTSTTKTSTSSTPIPAPSGSRPGLPTRPASRVAEEAVRGGRAMLAVVMNGENSYQTAADLLNRGFTVPAAAERKDPLLPPAARARTACAPSAVAPPAPATGRRDASHRRPGGRRDGRHRGGPGVVATDHGWRRGGPGFRRGGGHHRRVPAPAAPPAPGAGADPGASPR